MSGFAGGAGMDAANYRLPLGPGFPAPGQPTAFADNLRAFRYRTRRTEARERNGVPYFSNEFWTSGQRQASRLHEVSYRACFKPQLPAFFIERLTRPGDAVYDPFMGRGTTPLQAALMGRRPVGCDINPLLPHAAPPAPGPAFARRGRGAAGGDPAGGPVARGPAAAGPPGLLP